VADGVQYYYCTRGEYTADGSISAWSSSTTSTQDATAPTPQLAALPAYQPGTAIAVSWSGSDSGSGMKDYTVQGCGALAWGN
jgi:hypothetical protein